MYEYCEKHGVPERKCPYCALERAVAEKHKAEDAIVSEAVKLVESGYDGPFMGNAVSDLFMSVNKLRQCEKACADADKARQKWIEGAYKR